MMARRRAGHDCIVKRADQEMFCATDRRNRRLSARRLTAEHPLLCRGEEIDIEQQERKRRAQ